MTKCEQVRRVGAAAAGAVGGALLWKQHRVWGFLLGGLLTGGIYNLVTGAAATVGAAATKTQTATEGLDE